MRLQAILDRRERASTAGSKEGAARAKMRFKREIAPKLDAFTLAEIAAATGLSLAACSRVRAGVRIPHERHWELLALIKGLDA